jgi:hypothetical protein
VNTILRAIIVFLISLTFSVGVFAESDTGTMSKSGSETQARKTQSIDKQDDNNDDKEDTGSVLEAKKEKIKQEISSYIIDSYKSQWDKILKDIDQTLQKTTPDISERIEAYEKIQSSLEARRQRNKNSLKINETSKVIVDAFLWHMIDSIEKKKKELRAL